MAFLSIAPSSNSQTVDPATGLTLNNTGNVLNLGGGLPWSGTVTGSAGGTSGGSTAAYNPGTGNIIFGYTPTTVSQSIAINQALANAGTGIQLSGYKYQWQIHNDLSNSNSNRGTLTGNVALTGPTGNILESFNYNYNQNLPSFTTFSGTQFFNNRYNTEAVANITVSFTGKDQNFWAGYYGPRVHVDNFSLLYSIDPCKTNPAYSPTCSGFSSIVTSGNLVNPNLMSNGNVVYNTFAINTALQSSGSGVSVYGFNYGYNYSLGDATKTNECVSWTNAFTCGAYLTTNPTASMKATLTNSSNSVIYYARQDRNAPNTAENVSYQFLLPSTTNSLSLGTFTLGAGTSGNAAIQNMYVNALYKPDPCVTNTLSSTTCPGYATAYAKNMILGSTVASASAPTVSSTNQQPAGATSDPTQASQPQQQAQQTNQGQQTPPGLQQAGPAQDANQNPGSAQDNPSQPSTQQAGLASTTPQPAGGPPQTATASATQQNSGSQQAGPSGGGGGPSKLAMSVVKSAQAREQAIQATAVQNAAKAFEGTVQSSNAASNAAVATNQDLSANSATAAAQFSSQTTQASLQANTQLGQGPQQTQQSTIQQQQAIKSIEITQQIQAIIQQQTVESSVTSITLKAPDSSQAETPVQANSGTGLTVSRNPFGYNPLMASATSNMPSSLIILPPMYQPKLDTRLNEIEAPQFQIASFGGTGNPLNEIMMQQRFELMQTSIAQQPGSSVNRNVLPNELAGGIDITSMASLPNGFNAYSFVLKDSVFYESKEVYKNQRTIDNERVLRGLTRGSDSLHQQMVDQQYKSGE